MGASVSLYGGCECRCAPLWAEEKTHKGATTHLGGSSGTRSMGTRGSGRANGTSSEMEAYSMMPRMSVPARPPWE